jgi:phosphoglycolate phosphatase-like HAD superfamily hydrolase
MTDLETQLKEFELVCWDFDGVIKDSVHVKTEAFYELFLKFGKEIARRVKDHHEQNGGMSRYEKIPIYLGFANQKTDRTSVNKVSEDFSKIVVSKVINSPWVDQSKKYLDKYFAIQNFVIITATPKNEIDYILRSLKVDHYFKSIYGSPIKKGVALKRCLDAYNIPRCSTVMVGDSSADLEAAKANRVSFILRKTSLNKNIQKLSLLKQFE